MRSSSSSSSSFSVVPLVVGLALLAGSASAARPKPSRFATTDVAINTGGGAEQVEADVLHKAFKDGGPTGLLKASPACSKAYSILNADAGYLAAISNVFDDAKAVGAEAAADCMKHLHLSYDPIGATCEVSSTPFWTPDRHTDLPILQKAANAALKDYPLDHNPLVWLDETVVTSSPLAMLPFLALELNLYRILPIFVPKSCANDADMLEVLAYFNAACKRDEPTLRSCTFTKWTTPA